MDGTEGDFPESAAYVLADARSMPGYPLPGGERHGGLSRPLGYLFRLDCDLGVVV